MTSVAGRTMMMWAMGAVLAAAGSASADEPKTLPPSGAPAMSGGASGGVDLRPRYRAGQELAFVQRMVRSDTIKMALGEQTTKLECTALWKVKVLSAGDAGAEVVLTIDAIKASTEQEGVAGAAKKETMQTSWDSAGTDHNIDNPVVQAFRPLIGMRLTLALDADYQITGVSGNEGLRATQGVLQQQAYQMLSTEGLKTRWGQVLAVKKGKGQANPGESWKEEIVSAPGPLGRSKTVVTATLKSVTDGFATVTLTGSYEYIGAKEGEAAAAKVEDTSLDGTCLWDVKAGLCKSLDWNQKYAIVASAQGIEVRRSSDVTITTTRQ